MSVSIANTVPSPPSITTSTTSLDLNKNAEPLAVRGEFRVLLRIRN